MSDPKKTIYQADPHTQAKHRILGAYLERWLPILDRQAQNIGKRKQRLLYVDGFAGAGEYEDNVPGSPLIPIHTVANHSHQFSCPIEIRLIEKRADRVEHLQKLIREAQAKFSSATNMIIPEPVEGDCEEEIRKIIAQCVSRSQPVGPAFFFLDQYGYSSFSMDLVKSILQHDVCEIFSYLNWNLLHPFMSDPAKSELITKAFGGDEWRVAIDCSGIDRERRFQSAYINALRNRGGAKFVYPFQMRNSDNRIIYWLFFSTNNIRGLGEMKRAMWTVDRSGGFEFSDKFVSDKSSLFKYDDEDLARDLLVAHDGSTQTVQQLKEYSLSHTPAYKCMEAFGLLERDGHLRPVDPPAGRRARSFESFPDMRVSIRRRFHEKQGSLF